MKQLILNRRFAPEEQQRFDQLAQICDCSWWLAEDTHRQTLQAVWVINYTATEANQLLINVQWHCLDNTVLLFPAAPVQQQGQHK